MAVEIFGLKGKRKLGRSRPVSNKSRWANTERVDGRQSTVDGQTVNSAARVLKFIGHTSKKAPAHAVLGRANPNAGAVPQLIDLIEDIHEVEARLELSN